MHTPQGVTAMASRRKFYSRRVHKPCPTSENFPYTGCTFPYDMLGPTLPARDLDGTWNGTLRGLNPEYVGDVDTFFQGLYGVTSIEEMASRLQLSKRWEACDGSVCAELIVTDVTTGGPDSQLGARVQIRRCIDLNVRGAEWFMYFYFPWKDIHNDPTRCAREIGATIACWKDPVSGIYQSGNLLTEPQQQLRNLLIEVCRGYLPPAVRPTA